jgi:hypothetical protein
MKRFHTKPQQTYLDLLVVDGAHEMSALFFDREVKRDQAL